MCQLVKHIKYQMRERERERERRPNQVVAKVTAWFDGESMKVEMWED